MAVRDKANRLLIAALTRPLNLLAPGAGLVASLAGAPWWTFPLSLVPYGAMVVLSTRDPKFIRATLDGAAKEPLPPRADPAAVASPVLRTLLTRIAAAEANIAAQVEQASPSLRPILAATLEQVRSASALGEELARKLEGLDASLASMDAERALANARKRRDLAERAGDPALRGELLQAAASYEDAARHTQSLEALRRRTYAQLDGVAASLENAAVRAVRIRVASGDDEGARAVSDALRVDVETLRETLAVFEDPATQAETLARQEPTKR